MFWNLTAFNVKLMKGKPTRRQRRIQMLHDLTNNGGSVALKWAAEDRERDTEKGCQKQETTELMSVSLHQGHKKHSMLIFAEKSK